MNNFEELMNNFEDLMNNFDAPKLKWNICPNTKIILRFTSTVLAKAWRERKAVEN